MTERLDVATGVQGFLDAFESSSMNGAPAWLRERREAAILRFAETGFPTTRQEAWRFTDVTPIAERRFAPVEEPRIAAMPVNAVEALRFGESRAHRAVFLNGHFAVPLSVLGELPAGVRLESLRAAVERDSDLVRAHLGKYANERDNPFTALSMAFGHDGAFVYVPSGVVLERPLHVAFLAHHTGSRERVWHPRNLVIVERGAEASLIESYEALSDGTYWTNVVTEVRVGENARLDAYRVQRESSAAYHTATTQSSQARDSVYSLTTFALGGTLTRHDLNAVLDGDGAECTLNGLSQLSGQQHVDHHTTLVHAHPHCTSWEYFNGVFDERARGVFNGRIVVRPGAQRTDSKQTNNNLLLSQHARADSQPQLEIYADDVKCTHGATLGPIDERQLFYLRSRGLSAEDARNLLTYGFSAEILAHVKLEELRTRLDRAVRQRLHEQSAERVGS